MSKFVVAAAACRTKDLEPESLLNPAQEQASMCSAEVELGLHQGQERTETSAPISPSMSPCNPVADRLNLHVHAVPYSETKCIRNSP